MSKSPEKAPLEQVEHIAQKVANIIRWHLPKGWGFITILLSYGEGGHATYVSDLERDGTIKALREMADILENNREQKLS